MNFKLVPNNQELSSVRAYFSSLNWYSTAITAFETQNNQATLKSLTTGFCRRVVNEVIGLGLNEFDGTAVLWAIYKGMTSNFSDMKDNEGCLELLKDFKKRI